MSVKSLKRHLCSKGKIFILIRVVLPNGTRLTVEKPGISNYFAQALKSVFTVATAKINAFHWEAETSIRIPLTWTHRLPDPKWEGQQNMISRGYCWLPAFYFIILFYNTYNFFPKSVVLN